MKKVFKWVLISLCISILLGCIFLFRPIASSINITQQKNTPTIDVVLIGGGIMSATLGTYLYELEPNWKVQMFERLDQVAEESSKGLNNAGTGHSGFMEMNYTPEKNNQINIQKAVTTAEQFEVSKQFWAYQVKHHILHNPKSFIHPVPHVAFVWGKQNVDFLKKRYASMTQNPLFYGMKYTENPIEIEKWAPLIMHGRNLKEKVAATYMDVGSDINYGEITKQLIQHLTTNPNFHLNTSTEVTGISQNNDKTWTISYLNLKNNQKGYIRTKYVFIGAGGATIKLLQYTGLKEAKQYAGFPIGGTFLITDNPTITAQHTAKVYGRAELGAPPMSVPHIDTRYIDGKKYVLFGPFATYSNKFLKHGSQSDLLMATHQNNIIPMLSVGFKNLDLVQYLIDQVMMSKQEQLKELRKYYPEAKSKDWNLSQGGQRVQIIKKDSDQPAVLKFGTEIFASPDGTLTALLGASPGASTSPYIMLTLLEQVFPKQVSSTWNHKIKKIVPSYQQELSKDPILLDHIRTYTSSTLGLDYTSRTTHNKDYQPILNTIH